MALTNILLTATICVLFTSCSSSLFLSEVLINFYNTVQDCLDEDVASYCSDCYTSVFCSGVNETLQIPCTEDTVCFEEDGFSTCVDESVVPDCICPRGVPYTKLPDVYDNQKFIVCTDGEAYVEECPDDEYYYPELEDCEYGNPITTTIVPTTTPLPECPADCSFTLVAVGCTSFIICLEDCSHSDVIECDPGYIFNEDTGNCDFYYPFTCPDEPGYYADTTNCTVLHLCENGNDYGTISCTDGQVADNSTGQCTDDVSKCTATEDCGICKDGDTRIGIDCTRYWQCEGTESTGYEPVLKECPSGYYFDNVNQYCDLEVEGCPQSSKLLH